MLVSPFSSDVLVPMTSTTVVVVLPINPAWLPFDMEDNASVLTELAFCVVNGVNACRAEKVPGMVSLFNRLGAFCGLAGLPMEFCKVDPFMLDDLENELGAIVDTGAQMEGDGGVGAGSNPPDPLELLSEPTSRSVGEGKSLKKKPFGEKGLLIGLKPSLILVEPLP